VSIKPNTYFLWRGKLAKVIATSDLPQAHFVMVDDEDKDKCKNCGTPQETEHSVIVSSPLWKECAKPVQTLD
jgi:hypothetical protein